MNRTQKRTIIRNLKYRKKLGKKSVKGAFGRLPQYIMNWREAQKCKKEQKTIVDKPSKPQDVVSKPENLENTPNI